MAPLGEKYVAIDLGAESGRVVLGTFDGTHLDLREVSRFANRLVRLPDGLHWDVLQLWYCIKDSLSKVAAEYGRDLAGIGLDTWGVDYALLDAGGALLGIPYHYRDERTEGVLEILRHYVSEWGLYSVTGLPFTAFTTLSQLLAMRGEGNMPVDSASSLLMMPDLLNYWLCGCKATEATIAGTTQFCNLRTRSWDRDLLELMGIPMDLLQEIVPSGTVLGPISGSVGEEVGLGPVDVIAPACHDTAAAAVAIPSIDESVTFISSGTWSVIARELTAPTISTEAMQARFFNSVGACGRVLLDYNSVGLWALQECRREWHRSGDDWTYDDLTEMAANARPLEFTVNPDAPEFFLPGNMLDKVRSYCERSGQGIPSQPDSIVRSLLEGVTFRYRQALEALDRLTGRRAEVVHILGGGSRNALLCQMTADATNRVVLAGPAEATAIATVLLQALARGSLDSLQELREVVIRSCPPVPYEPHPGPLWETGYARFLSLTEGQDSP